MVKERENQAEEPSPENSDLTGELVSDCKVSRLLLERDLLLKPLGAVVTLLLLVSCSQSSLV